MRSNLLMLHLEDLDFRCNNYKYIFYNMMQIKKLIVAGQWSNRNVKPEKCKKRLFSWSKPRECALNLLFLQ